MLKKVHGPFSQQPQRSPMSVFLDQKLAFCDNPFHILQCTAHSPPELKRSLRIQNPLDFMGPIAYSLWSGDVDFRIIWIGSVGETDLCCVFSVAVTVIKAGESSMASKYSVSSSSSLASSLSGLSLPSVRRHTLDY